jgi:dinuclear metal center YbgI/SA1388 family protein
VIYEDVIKKIEEIAPPDLAPPWDNSGVQIHTGRPQIEKILVCLEINGEIIEEAKENGVDLIVSHHPLIFHPLKSIEPWGYSDSPPAQEKVGAQVTAKYVIDLIKADISVYSAHISFDRAPAGNNAHLARLLDLRDVRSPEQGEDEAVGIIGDFAQPILPEEVLDRLSKVQGISREEMRIVGAPDRLIRTVALCTGGGEDFLPLAIAEGCDLFITGDVRFHQAQLAHAAGIALIDAGHFGTEKIFEKNLAGQLEESLGGDVEVMVSRVWGDPFAKG